MKLTQGQVITIAQLCSKRLTKEILHNLPNTEFAPGDNFSFTYDIKINNGLDTSQYIEFSPTDPEIGEPSKIRIHTDGKLEILERKQC